MLTWYDKRVCFVDLSDKVGPAFFCSLDIGGGATLMTSGFQLVGDILPMVIKFWRTGSDSNSGDPKYQFDFKYLSDVCERAIFFLVGWHRALAA